MLAFEQLESRCLTAVAEFRLNVLDDVDTPNSFWLEIVAEDVRDEPLGIYGASLDIIWDPKVFALAEPFSVHSFVTAKFPGWLGEFHPELGWINALTGIAGFGAGQPIGQYGPERFAVLHMAVIGSGETEIELRPGMYGMGFMPPIWTTLDDFSFDKQTIQVEHREYGPGFVGPLPADVYFAEYGHG